jgi:uncharacterized membrane protein
MEENLKSKRIALIDELRGALIILVVIYNAFYSMVMIYGYAGLRDAFSVMLRLQPLLRASFIVLSGIAFQLSRSNIKRGVILLAVAGGMMLAIWLVMPSQMIWFGIIHFLGAANLLLGAVKKYIDRIPTAAGLIVFGVLFLLTFNVPRGFLGFDGLFAQKLPDFLYSSYFGVVFGFPPADFFSSDYNPFVPWLFLFVFGTILGRYVTRLPETLKKTHLRLLAFVGRHTLIIYLVHQPIIVGVLELVSRFGQ